MGSGRKGDMVVLAASVLTKSGKGEMRTKKNKKTDAKDRNQGWPTCQRNVIDEERDHTDEKKNKRGTIGAVLVSRQYKDVSRIRIEGLLSAFPKLVGTAQQHTYVETDAVRYVYQPVEVRLAGGREHDGKKKRTMRRDERRKEKNKSKRGVRSRPRGGS